MKMREKDMSQSTEDPFNPQQTMFIAYYPRFNCNGTKAYKQAYGEDLSDDVAAVNASKLLRNTKIKAAIDKKLQDIADIAELDAAWSLKNLKNIAERCQQAEPVMEFDREEKCMVRTGEYKFDSAGANSAIDKINKMLGCYAAEKTDQTITTNITITNYADLKDLDEGN